MRVEAEAGTSMATAAGVNARAQLVGPVVTAAGAAVVGLAAFLPWLRNGHVTRNSFQMMRTAELLDVVTGVATVALRAWYLVPLLVGVVWFAAALDRHRITAVVGLVLAAATGAVSFVVLRSGVPTGVGPRLALLGAAVVVIGVVLTLRPSGRPS